MAGLHRMLTGGNLGWRPGRTPTTQKGARDVASSLTCVKTAIGKVEMKEMPVPSPGPGQMVVKTTLNSICGTNMHFVDEFPMFPGVDALPMGHEAVGIVQAGGAG